MKNPGEVIAHVKKYLLCLFLFAFISACQIFDGSEGKAVIAVGKTGVSKAEVRGEIGSIISEMGMTDEEAKTAIKSIIEKITEKYLIMEYGKEQGITVSGEELEVAVRGIKSDYPESGFNEMLLQRYIDINTWKEELRQDLLIKKVISKVLKNIPDVTFNEIIEYYESHKDEFARPRMIQLRQIVTRSREEAEEILQRLSEGYQMAELAKEYSITPDAEKGGVMGWIAKGQLEEEIEATVFTLPVGERSPIMSSPYGYHIFEVLSVSDARVQNLLEVKADIESILASQKKEEFYAKWVEGLKDRFPVSIDEDIYADWNKEE
jgi:parvulin-like peptidyl-prolyl isomerase